MKREESGDDDSSHYSADVVRDPKEEAQAEVQAIKQLAHRETKRITFWRAIVLVMILATGAVVSTLVYFFLSKYHQSYIYVNGTP